MIEQLIMALGMTELCNVLNATEYRSLLEHYKNKSGKYHLSDNSDFPPVYVAKKDGAI